MDITKFCAKPIDARTYLHDLINMDGKTIGCDGHAIIYKESIDREESCCLTERSKENLQKIIADIDGFNNFLGSFQVPEFSPDKCKTCNGEGQTSKNECPECDGEKIVVFENAWNEYECDCETCGGSGFVNAGEPQVCEECGGGEVYYKGVEIAQANINPRYWLMIADQPELQVGYMPSRRFLVFKFKEFRGAIMEMTR